MFYLDKQTQIKNLLHKHRTLLSYLETIKLALEDAYMSYQEQDALLLDLIKLTGRHPEESETPAE